MIQFVHFVSRGHCFLLCQLPVQSNWLDEVCRVDSTKELRTAQFKCIHWKGIGAHCTEPSDLVAAAVGIVHLFRVNRGRTELGLAQCALVPDDFRYAPH